MENYVVHAGEYDFSSLCFPVPLSSIDSFATKNNLSINVYGVEDEKKVIYPLRVTEAVIADRVMEYNIIQPLRTLVDWLVIS